MGRMRTWRFGFDLDDTLGAQPKMWKFITEALMDAGAEVHVVTATHHDKATDEDYAARKDQLASLGIAYTDLYIAEPPICDSKRKYAKTVGLHWFVDNRAKNVAAVSQECPVALFIDIFDESTVGLG